jgi:hypothetical protein
MKKEEMMDWFKSCGHEIFLTQSNLQKGYIGVAICKDTRNTFRASGEDMTDVLYDLKSMLTGTYNL